MRAFYEQIFLSVDGIDSKPGTEMTPV